MEIEDEEPWFRTIAGLDQGQEPERTRCDEGDRGMIGMFIKAAALSAFLLVASAIPAAAQAIVFGSQLPRIQPPPGTLAYPTGHVTLDLTTGNFVRTGGALGCRGTEAFIKIENYVQKQDSGGLNDYLAKLYRTGFCVEIPADTKLTVTSHIIQGVSCVVSPDFTPWPAANGYDAYPCMWVRNMELKFISITNPPWARMGTLNQ